MKNNNYFGNRFFKHYILEFNFCFQTPKALKDTDEHPVQNADDLIFMGCRTKTDFKNAMSIDSALVGSRGHE